MRVSWRKTHDGWGGREYDDEEDIDEDIDEDESEDKNNEIENLIQQPDHNDDHITQADIDMTADMIGKEMQDTEYYSKLRIIDDIVQQLPRYYKINLYLGIHNTYELPSITIQVDEYKNEFDQKGNRIKTTQNSKPTIIKPTFCILDDDRNQDEYIQDFINFMDNLSPDYNCLNMLGIKNTDNN